MILPPVGFADSPEGHTVVLRPTGAIAASMLFQHFADASGTVLTHLGYQIILLFYNKSKSSRKRMASG